MVEDDRSLADLVAEVLDHEGFSPYVLYEGHGVVEHMMECRPDLVLLDLMLPGKDGFTICRECRRFYMGPILMLTARGEDVDQILGLELGADDYVVKPVVPRVLVARIRALLRRSAAVVSAMDIDLGGVVIRPRERAVYAEHKPVDLTSAEYELLLYLAERAGTVVDREVLYRDLRGIKYDGLDRSIDLRVSRIRSAIRKLAPALDPIQTVHGRGYMIRAHK